MNWINNLFYMGLFTALTGSIAFAVYAVVAGVLDGLKKYRYIYGLLLVVLPFWLFPGLFLLLYVTHYRKMGEALFIKGHLFELTPVIAHIECVAAVVWLLGAATVLVLHLVRYYRVEHYIKKHRMPAEKRLQLVAAGTKERLKIRGNGSVLWFLTLNLNRTMNRYITTATRTRIRVAAKGRSDGQHRWQRLY